MITFEYILIDEINDDLEQAELLAKHAKKLNAKVNLIPYNQVEGLNGGDPNFRKLALFIKQWKKEGLPESRCGWKKGTT